MRTAFVVQALGIFLVGCNNGDTGFTKEEKNPTPVSGDAIMEVSATSVAWTDMEVGQTYSKEFTITSVGEIDLQIDEARILVGGDVFYLPEVWKNDQILPKDDSVTMTLTASLSEDELREGSMRIKSNDSTTVELIVPLTASPVGWSGGGEDTGQGTTDSGDSTDSGNSNSN
jgi:hypothetical protein